MKLRLLSVTVLAIIAFLYSSCSNIQNRPIKEKNNDSFLSVMVGSSAGGFVENTEMLGNDQFTEVDAITGATQSAFQVSVHREFNIRKHNFESGVDYLHFDQSIRYQLPTFDVDGKRDFQFKQIRVPLTYNWNFLIDESGNSKLKLKAGFSTGFTFFESASDSSSLPSYSFNKVDAGPTIGFVFYPYSFVSLGRFGFYADAYRGMSKIYDDIYHKGDGIGDNSYMKFGIVFQPTLKK